MLHTGVINSDPIPIIVTLNNHECTSWKSESAFGENVDVSSIVSTRRFSLDVSIFELIKIIFVKRWFALKIKYKTKSQQPLKQ